MKRRDFILRAGALTANAALAATFLKSMYIESVVGSPVPVGNLKQALHPDEALVVVPGDENFAQFQGSFNKRMILTPQVRVLCKTREAAAAALNWAVENKVPLALRSG